MASDIHWKTFSVLARRENTLVTNFMASRRPAFEKAIADLNLGHVLEIREKATDVTGQIQDGYLSLHKIGGGDLSLFWDRVKALEGC